MTGWLVDLGVLNAFAPGKRVPPKATRAWFEQRSDALFLSVLAAQKIESRIAELRRAGAGDRADGLAEWFEQVASNYKERILPFDLAAARAAGGLELPSEGPAPSLERLILNGTAKAHGLTVLALAP